MFVFIQKSFENTAALRILSLSDISLLPSDHYELEDDGKYLKTSLNLVAWVSVCFVRCFGRTQLSYGVVAVLLCVISLDAIFRRYLCLWGGSRCARCCFLSSLCSDARILLF